MYLRSPHWDGQVLSIWLESQYVRVHVAMLTNIVAKEVVKVGYIIVKFVYTLLNSLHTAFCFQAKYDITIVYEYVHVI